MVGYANNCKAFRYNDELLADWELCQNGEKPFQIV